MSRLIYFVVGVDLDNEEVYIDDETFSQMFTRSQQVWDTGLNTWREYEGEEYERALEFLNSKPLRND